MSKVTKFENGSVEAVAIKTIQARQKKIDKAGTTLVSLWYEQGKELKELQAILECSQNQLVKHTGLGRSAMKAYMGIAEDPRLGEEGVAKQLGAFNQKQLVQLGKLDEDEFEDALKTGALPAHKEPSNIKEPKAPKVTDVDPEPKIESKWASDIKAMIDDADGDYDTAKEAILAYFAEDADVEEEEEEDAENETTTLAKEAISLTDEDDITDQALAIGIKKGVLKKALAGEASKPTLKKLTDYVNS